MSNIKYVSVLFPVPKNTVLKERIVRPPKLGEFCIAMSYDGTPRIIRSGEGNFIYTVIVEEPENFCREEEN